MHEESYPAPDWAHWLARDLWRLDQAVALSLGIEPSRVVGDRVRMPGVDSRRLLPDVAHVPGKLLAMKPLPAEYFERLALAESCADISLPVRHRQNDRVVKALVEAAPFAAWGHAKGFTLPPELGRFATGDVAAGGDATKTELGFGETDGVDAPRRNAVEAAAVPVNGGEVAIDKAAMLQRLAEWIFARHPRSPTSDKPLTCKKLLDGALQDPELGTFSKANFLAAYQKVYATKRWRPSVTGWPLQPEYRRHLKEEQKYSK